MADDLDPRWHGASIPADHWHFHRQLLSRYGIVLAPGEFSQMRNQIRDGSALLISKRRGRTAIYSVRLQTCHERIYVLGDRARIVTAWPPSAKLNEQRRALLRAKDEMAEAVVQEDIEPPGSSL